MLGGVHGRPIRVEEVTKGVDGALSSRTVDHRVFLGAGFGDTPAGRKLNKHLGHSVLHGCMFCLLLGRSCGNAVCFAGYRSAVPTGCPPTLLQDPLFTGYPSSAQCGDPAISLSSDMQKARTERFLEARRAASSKTAVEKEVKRFGVHGRSVFMELLGHYLDPNAPWIVPLAHAALLGVVKLFLSCAFRDTSNVPQNMLPDWVVRKASRAIIAARGRHIRLTNDFNRPFRCLVTKRGNYVMEDFLHLLEYSRYLFHALEDDTSVWPHPDMQRAWECLQLALLHYFRFEEGGFTPEARKAAADHLYEFAQLWEGLLGLRACTFNLHLLVCRLYDQETECGHASFLLEFWVETQLIQYMKSDVKFRTTSCPELIFVNGLMMDRAVAKMLTLPDISGCDSNSAPWSPTPAARGTSAAAAGMWDLGGVHAGARFMALGRGTSLASGTSEHAAAISGWSSRDGKPGYPEECMGGGVIEEAWEDLLSPWGDRGAVTVTAFARACKDGGDELQSELHSQARTRENSWAVCVFEEDEAEVVPYVVQIQRFLKFESEGLPALRAADVRLFKCVVDAPGLFKVAEFDTSGYGYMVPLPCIAHKVFHCNTGASTHFFVKYNVISRTLGGEVFFAPHAVADDAE